MYKKNYHPSKFINIPDWGLAEIDVKLVSAIIELNKIGLHTRQCCQGDNKQYRYITFDLKNLTIDQRLNDGPADTITFQWDVD